MMAKAKREEDDTRRQMMANRDTLEVLQRQVAALEAHKQNEKALVEEEARILVSQSVISGPLLCILVSQSVTSMHNVMSAGHFNADRSTFVYNFGDFVHVLIELTA